MLPIKSTSVEDCKIINLDRIHFRAGNITPLEGQKDLPFSFERIFYLYDIPGGESRGAHAHKECHQFLVSASGAFEVRVNDGKEEKIFYLNRPYYGLHIPPGIWASELNFSSGSICLVLASHKYDEDDYIRDMKDFRRYKDRANEI